MLASYDVEIDVRLWIGFAALVEGIFAEKAFIWGGLGMLLIGLPRLFGFQGCSESAAYPVQCCRFRV